MMTPPRNWHVDGSMRPYSNEDSFFSAIKAIVKRVLGIDDIFIDVEEDVSVSLFVFGPIGAGKTTFLEKIGASVTTAGIGTATETYPSFRMNLGNKTITIEEGEDIGGDPRNLRNGTLEQMINTKDKIVFIFDAKAFLNNADKSYRGVVMSRLCALYNANSNRNNIFIIASRLDTFEHGKYYIENEIRKQLIGKTYKDILNQSFGAYNLTSDDDIQTIKNIVFKQN